MIEKKVINKFLKGIILFSLVLTIIFIPGITYASERTTPVPKTRVTITNTETGKVTQYNLENVSTQKVIDKGGNEVYVSSFNILDNNRIRLNATQQNEDTFYGYKGTIEITYTDDGKYACLKSVYAHWKKESGNNTLSNMNINYGQSLGTNSKNGYYKVTGAGNAAIFNTGFKPGKYGYGSDFFLGATLNGKIGSNQVAIECNVNF